MELDENTSKKQRRKICKDDLFFEASKRGDLEQVKYLIKKGANVHYIRKKVVDTTFEPKTALFTAAAHGHLDVVKYLVELDRKVLLYTGNLQYRVIHAACYLKGSTEVVKYLLSFPEVDVEASTNSLWRPVHFACNSGRLDILKVLVNAKADLFQKTSLMQTTLYLAANSRNTELIKYLYDRGLDPNVKDSNDTPCIHRMIRYGDLDMTRTLVEYCHCDLNILDGLGCSVLEEADRDNMSEMAVYLWKMGAEIKQYKNSNHIIKCHRPRFLNRPPDRYNSNLCIIGSTIYLLGGEVYRGKNWNTENRPDNDNRIGTSGDLWCVDLNTACHTSMVPEGVKITRPGLLLDRSKVSDVLYLHDDDLTVETKNFEACRSVPHLVVATEPFLRKEKVGYFEILVINPGPKRIVTIGLVDYNYPLKGIQPGWKASSFGYHGDDGGCFHDNGFGKNAAERFDVGDVIGCGINYETEEVWFCKNGIYLGTMFRYPQKNKYYAAVGLEGYDVKVRVNFGASPFAFDFIVPTLCWIMLAENVFHTGVNSHYMMVIHPDKDNGGDESTGHTTDAVDMKSDDERSMWKEGASSGTPEVKYAKGTGIIEEPWLLMIKFMWNEPPAVYRYIPSANYLEYIDTQSQGVVLPSSHVIEMKNKLYIFSGWINRRNVYMYEFDLKTFEWKSRYDCVGILSRRLNEQYNKYEKAFFTAIDGNLAFVGDSSVLFFNVDTYTIYERPINIGRSKISSFSVTPYGGHYIATMGGWNNVRQQSEIVILDTETLSWFKPRIVGVNFPRPRNSHGVLYFETDHNAFSLDYKNENFDVPIVPLSKLIKSLRRPPPFSANWHVDRLQVPGIGADVGLRTEENFRIFEHYFSDIVMRIFNEEKGYYDESDEEEDEKEVYCSSISVSTQEDEDEDENSRSGGGDDDANYIGILMDNDDNDNTDNNNNDNNNNNNNNNNATDNQQPHAIEQVEMVLDRGTLSDVVMSLVRDWEMNQNPITLNLNQMQDRIYRDIRIRRNTNLLNQMIGGVNDPSTAYEVSIWLSRFLNNNRNNEDGGNLPLEQYPKNLGDESKDPRSEILNLSNDNDEEDFVLPTPKKDDKKYSWLALAMGWNGGNLMFDFDLISLHHEDRPQEISALFNDPLFSDFMIDFCNDDMGAGSHFAHRIILKARSPYFSAYFAENPRESRVEIGEPSSLFVPFLKFIYSDSIDIDQSLASKYRDFIAMVNKYSPELAPRLIEELLTTKVYEPKLLYKHIGALFLISEFSDFSFKMGEKVFPVHKCIVAPISSFFSGMMTSGFRESSESEIILNDVDPDVFLQVLSYIYTKKINFDVIIAQGDIIDVFLLASRFDIFRLKSELEYVISYNLNDENVSSLLLIADQQSACVLKEACISYISRNYNRIVDLNEFKELKSSIIGLLDAEKKDYLAKKLA